MRKQKGIRRSLFAVLTIGLVLIIGPLCLAQAKAQKQAEVSHSGMGHKAITPDKVVWTQPPTLPSAFQMAVLDGDPAKDGGQFTIRIRGTDARVPPHWHPNDEHLTVIKGIFLLGTGEKFDQTALHALTAGSYGFMPKEMRHFGQFKGETIVQVHGVGPFKVFYVNPADDPAAKTSKK
jgi:hypothetical protein